MASRADWELAREVLRRADPVRRISKPRAALIGKLRVSGRRPWLLPGFFRIVRLPS